jgi:hypothetical protein
MGVSAATGGRRRRSSLPRTSTNATCWSAHQRPDEPAAEPSVRYPQAGTSNAVVTLWVFDLESGDRVEVTWDHERFPYLARVDWSEGSPLTVLVQTRDQRTVRLLEAGTATGATTVVAEQTDPRWVELTETRRCVWPTVASSTWWWMRRPIRTG